MSEWLPQIQPRHAFDVRTELRNGVQFLEENSIVYGVGRHLAIHQLDNPTILGTEPLQQDMTFLMRPFIDRPPMPAIATALGGQGPNTNVAASAAGYDANTTAALLPTGAKPSATNMSDATTSVLSDLSARQHAAQLTELIEKESFLQDRSMLMSAFGIIACPSNAPSIAESAGSATAASGPSGFPDRGARRQLALAEYSEANRMATVSILDLRRLRQKGSVAEGGELNQINVKDIRSHTLFLPWSQFAESKIRVNKDDKNSRKKEKPGATDEESVNLNLTSVEQTVAAAVMAADSSNPNLPSSAADPSSASSTAAHAASNLASSLKIESTIYASSAPRIIQSKFKDRSPESMVERRARKAAEKQEKIKRRKLRQDARQIAEFKDAEIPSDEDFSGSSCTDEEDNDELQQALADEESGSDFHSQVREALDSEDEQLLSEHEDEASRKDEDFDYERARKDETSSYASGRGSSTGRKGSSNNRKKRSPSPKHHANASKINLTRKLTHTLAQTPINRSLAVAYKNGLFQQPNGVDAAAQVAQAAPLNPAQSTAFQLQVTQKSSFSKVIALEFSADGRYLAIQCDGPAWPLLIWDWQYRQRIMGHPRWVRQPVHTIRWNPNDNTEISVMGPQVFLQYKLQSSVKHQEASVTSLVTLLNKEEQFSSFCYLPQHHDAMIVCKTNKILVLNRAVVIQSLDISSLLASIPNPVSGGAPIPASAFAHSSGVSAIVKNHHISSVCPTEKGFAIGTSIHPVGTAYPFSNEMGFSAGSLMTPFNSTNPSSHNCVTPFPSLLLLYEFQHSRTLDITPSFDFDGHPNQQAATRKASKKSGESDRVISTTLFDRSFHGQQQSKESMQAFRTKCIPLWRNQTGTSKKLPFSLHSLTVAPNHSTLALTSSTREVFLLNLSDVDLVDDSLAAQLYFKPLVEGLHNVPIIQMDVSQELPLVLTCSNEDNSVRIFNYLQRTCEIVKVFEEETPNCVAIHPSGYEMMVAFHHHLVQYRILLGSGELLLRGEITMPAITCIKYSNNGNYVAVVSSKVIYVYAANTLKAVVKLKGHSDIVTSLSWSGDDSLLTSVGSNGCIYTWHLKTGTRLHHQDYINNALSYNDIVTLPNGDIAVVGIQQHSLGFDMQGLLNPPLDATAAATVTGKDQKIYKRTMAPIHSPKKGELVYLSDIPNEAPKAYSTSSHQFVIQWNNRAKFLQNPTLLDASSALQYIHYDPEAAKTIEETGSSSKNSSARSPANRQNEDDATTIITPTAGKGLDFLATVEMEIKPYLPVATSFHQRSVSNAKQELELDRARGAVSRNVNEGHSRQRPGSAVMRSMPASGSGDITADSEAISRTSVSLRPKSAMPSNRRMASGSTLASFLNHDREKEECPLPTLLTTAMLQVGRMTFLLVGTPRGTIQLYPWPMVPGVADPISETPLHSEPITSLKVCQKTQVIVSTALDGSLFISSIAVVVNHALGSNVNSSATGTNDVDQSSHFGASPAAIAHATPSSPTYIFPLHLFLSPSFYPSLFSLTSNSRPRQDTYGEQKKLLDSHDDALVVLRKAERSRYGVRRLEGMEDEYDYSLCRRSESVSAQRELKELRAQLKQFQDEWEYKMRRDKENMGKILSEASSKHAEEKASLAAKETALTMRDNERERLTLERLNKKEKEYEITIVHLENLYEKKLALEAERYKELVKKMSDLDQRCALDRLKVSQEYDKRISDMTSRHDAERSMMQNEISSFQKRYSDLKEESVAIVEAECMENDVMLATVENTAKASDNDLRKQLLEMHESQALLRQQIAQLTLKLQRSQANQREAEVGKERSEAAQREGLKRTNLANKKVKSLEENEVVLQKQLEESHGATDKLKQEKRDLRDQIAALLQERADRDPAKTIAAFEAIVKEMDEEFLLAHVANRQAEAAAATHRSTEQALRNEIQLWKKRAEKKEIILEGLREDVWGMKDLRLLREKYFRVLLGEKSNVLGVGSSSKGAFDPSEGQKPWVGVGGGPNAPNSPSKGIATSRRGAESVEDTQAIEREYLRQTKKNMATISYLEHKVEERQKALSVSSSGHVADNVQLMTQINELRVVNRDFKEEIVRLTGVVAHQKLMLSAAARTNQSQAAQMGGFTAAANPQIQAMVSIRQAQQAAQLASPDDHAPPDMKAELQALAQLLEQEKRISAEATAQVDESESALRKVQARAIAVEESRKKIIAEQEHMISASAKRIEQQDAEIRHLRPLAAGHVSRVAPHAVTYAPTDGASIILPQQNANAHASYVDSILARAAALRTQLSSQASLVDAVEDDDEQEENIDVSNIPSSSNSSRPTSARPLSASFHFNQGADFSNQVHQSYAVPIRGNNTNRKPARPQTATVRGSKAVEMSTNSSGSGTPLEVAGNAPVAVKSARPASAVLKGGGRAGRNSWNASTATTRTGSSESSVVGSGASSVASTAGPTPIPAAQATSAFKQGLRGGALTTRARPSSAVHFSTNKSTPAATAATSSSANRTMISTWMEEPSAQLSVDAAGIKPSPPILRPSSAQTLAQVSRSQRPVSAVSIPSSSSTRPTSAVSEMSEGMLVHEDEDDDDY